MSNLSDDEEEVFVAQSPLTRPQCNGEQHETPTLWPAPPLCTMITLLLSESTPPHRVMLCMTAMERMSLYRSPYESVEAVIVPFFAAD